MTVVYMSTDDIYQLFLKFNVPGVRKDAGRLWKGVNTGAAGVMNQVMQAAHDPSAGQRALQAGEAVPQQCLAFDQQALVSAMSCTMTSVMTGVLQANNAAMAGIIQANNAAMTSAMQTLLTRMDDRVDAKLAENKADADAKLAEKLAENKSDIDALLAENKADADAQMAGVVKTLDQLVSGRALRKRTCIKRQYIAYPPDARRQTLQWLLQHSSHPYPTKDEVEWLLEQTGLETIKRMKILIYNVRNRDMQRDATGVWRQRVAM